MLYVPNYVNNNCAILYNSETIRVYERRPTASNTYYNYIDYYYNSHYSFNTGQQYFGTSYTTPTCRTDITTNIYYRNDFSDVLIVFFILSFIILWIPWCLFRLLFRK